MNEPDNIRQEQQGNAPHDKTQAANQPTSGLAIAGLVLGVVAAVTSFLPIINNASFFIALIGLVLAIAGFASTRKGKRSGKGIAVAGIVLGIVSVAIVLATQAMFSAAIDAVSDELNASSTLASGSASSENSESANADYKSLSVGTTIKLKDGSSITVNSIEGGIANYDGSELVCVNVTYANDGEKSISFNPYDWKAEDADGALRSQAFFMDGENEISSGELSPGGHVTGNIYFDAPVVRVHYYGNMFDDTSTAAWVA